MAHILVIEDEEALQFLLRIILEADGHSADQVQDGGSALDMLKAHPASFDMIILDVLLPKMDGFEFLSLLHNQPFHPPVIILSAYRGQLPPAIKHLVDGRLNKPFSQQQLNDKVKSLVGKSNETKPIYEQ